MHFYITYFIHILGYRYVDIHICIMHFIIIHLLAFGKYWIFNNLYIPCFDISQLYLYSIYVCVNYIIFLYIYMHVLEKWRKFYVSTFYDYSMVEIFQLLSHYLQFIEFCRSRSATRAIFMRIYNNNFHGSLAAIFYRIVLNIMFPPIYEVWLIEVDIYWKWRRSI